MILTQADWKGSGGDLLEYMVARYPRLAASRREGFEAGFRLMVELSEEQRDEVEKLLALGEGQLGEEH